MFGQIILGVKWKMEAHLLCYWDTLVGHPSQCLLGKPETEHAERIDKEVLFPSSVVPDGRSKEEKKGDAVSYTFISIPPISLYLNIHNTESL